MWTQTIIIHFLRTNKIPIIKSNASSPIIITSLLGVAIITSIQYIPKVNSWIKLEALPPLFYAWLSLFLGTYILLVSLVKVIYKKLYKQFL